MLPILIAGGAALFAFVLSGCSQTRKAEEPSPSRPPSPPKYSDDLGDDEKAKWLRLQLRLKRVPDSELDQGCPGFRYNPTGIQKIIEGKGDQKITSCEVYEYTLNRFQEDPALAEAITERPIPWSLDQRVFQVAESPLIQKKIDETFQYLESLLKRKGLQPRTSAYQETIAVALFYLVASPPPEQIVGLREKISTLQKKNNRSPVESQALGEMEKNLKTYDERSAKIDQELRSLDISEIKDFQKTHGFYVKGDYAKEYTALQALQEGVGECTEQSKILFALCRRAELSPQFILVDPWKSDDPWLSAWIKENPNYYHICIGLPKGGALRLFDPAIYLLDPPHRDYQVLTLRQYLSMDYMNRGGSWENKGDLNRAFEAYSAAIRLDENSFQAYVNRGNLWDDKGEPFLKNGDQKTAQQYAEKAFADFDRAVRINPFSAPSYHNRGHVRMRLGRWTDAEHDFDRAIELNPLLPNSYFQRAIVKFFNGRIQEGTKDFIAYLKLSPQKGADEVYRFLLSAYSKLSIPMRETIERETNLDIYGADAQVDTASMLWLGGHTEMALERIRPVFTEPAQRKKELEKEKKPLSPETIQFLKFLLNKFPPEMLQNPEMQSMRKALALPEKP